MVPVSSFLNAKRQCLSPHKNTPPPLPPPAHPFARWSDCYPQCGDFSMCSPSRNSVTPFSNKVNIVQLFIYFFSSLLRGDLLLLLKGAGALREKHQDKCKDVGAGVIFPIEVVCYLFSNSKQRSWRSFKKTIELLIGREGHFF